MWPLEIVKSYHKIHAKRSNICNTLPKQNVADIFVAYLPQFCIQNKILRREKRRNVPPNQTILFIYYFISRRHCGNILQPRLFNAPSIRPLHMLNIMPFYAIFRKSFEYNSILCVLLAGHKGLLACRFQNNAEFMRA